MVPALPTAESIPETELELSPGPKWKRLYRGQCRVWPSKTYLSKSLELKKNVLM